MKKFTAIGIAFALVFFSFISCGKKPSAPKAGSAQAEDMLTMIPKDVKGILNIDIHRAMAIEIASKAIQEDKSYQKIQEFTAKTGIDPQKDIYLVTVAITEATEKAKGAVIINLKYDKDTLLSLAKEKAEEEEEEIIEEEYNGLTIYSWGEKENVAISFIDDSNIAAGNMDTVKSIIDVFQKKGENVFKNEELSALLAKTNKEALFWGAISVPPEAMSKVASQNPFMQSFEAINAVSFYFDYKNKNIMAEIKLMSSDEAKSQQIAEALNGLKAIGGMAAAEDPNVGELLNGIEIASGADHVKISASLPEDLIEKLKQKKKEKEEDNI